jgi:hypothetical protein
MVSAMALREQETFHWDPFLEPVFQVVTVAYQSATQVILASETQGKSEDLSEENCNEDSLEMSF